MTRLMQVRNTNVSYKAKSHNENKYTITIVNVETIVSWDFLTIESEVRTEKLLLLTHDCIRSEGLRLTTTVIVVRAPPHSS